MSNEHDQSPDQSNSISPIKEIETKQEISHPIPNMPGVPDVTKSKDQQAVPSHIANISMPPKKTASLPDDTILDQMHNQESIDPVEPESGTEELEFISDDPDDTSNNDILTSTLHDILNTSPKMDEGTINAKDIRPVIPLSNYQDLSEALIEKGRVLGVDKFVEELKDATSEVSALRDSLSYFTAQYELSKDHLEKMVEEGKKLKDILVSTVNGVGTGVSSGNLPKNLVKKGKTLSGKVASMTVTAMMQGLRSVPLMNSGFYITVKAPTMTELSMYFNILNHDEYEYGRQLGAYYFMHSDHEVKKLILRTLLPKCLVNSNFQAWQDIDKLLKVISIHDYNTIVWAIASMVYRNGFDISLPCAKNKDKCKPEEFKLEVSTLRKVDSSKIPEEASNFMLSSNITRTSTELAKYRKLIAKPNVVRCKFENKSTDSTTYWHFKLKEANLYDILEHGEEFNNGLYRTLSTKKVSQADVVEFLTFNYYKSFLPWIESIVLVTEEGYEKDEPLEEEVIIRVENTGDDSSKETFNQLLDITQMEKSGFAEQILSYIERTKTTHMVLPYDACKSCGSLPDTSVEGFIPVDVAQLFFTISLMRMIVS